MWKHDLQVLKQTQQTVSGLLLARPSFLAANKGLESQEESPWLFLAVASSLNNGWMRSVGRKGNIWIEFPPSALWPEMDWGLGVGASREGFGCSTSGNLVKPGSHEKWWGDGWGSIASCGQVCSQLAAVGWYIRGPLERRTKYSDVVMGNRRRCSHQVRQRHPRISGVLQRV